MMSAAERMVRLKTPNASAEGFELVINSLTEALERGSVASEFRRGELAPVQ